MDDTTLALLIALGGALILVVIGWYWVTRSRSRRLREAFGPEYERAVTRDGRAEGEKLLDERKKRVEQYDLHPLPAEDRVRFLKRWDEAQARFVDDPEAAIVDAQRLVDEVMEARGYPIGDARRQQEDISVENPAVVSHYREARAIARRNEKGDASTEDLRIAIQHYRALFQTLLEGGGSAVVPEETEAHVR
ncbi:MAG TPA: hypothetical protein VJ788_00645 [Gemmatimonadota bacterium]|nr:hypothetical protein [Gemmatimonadota bacterium]